jgi:hypothetical protein
MPGEALSIIRIQAAKRPPCCIELAAVRAIVIPDRRILMDHPVLLAACVGTRTLQLYDPKTAYGSRSFQILCVRPAQPGAAKNIRTPGKDLEPFGSTVSYG